MVSTLLLDLNFPSLRSTRQWSPFYFSICTSPPNAPPYNDLRFISEFELPFPSAPPYNGFHYALQHTMVSVLLLQLNFHPLLLHHTMVSGFPLSEARGKDGPFIPCYASLPLEVTKAGGNKEDKTSLYGVVRGVHPCVALRRACARLICF